MKFNLCLSIWLALPITLAAQENFCLRTADIAQKACHTAAERDLLVAQGKCENFADPAAREACNQAAQADSQAAAQVCDAGLRVREAACKLLGPGRYDPVINPADFVDKVDNPFFPLKPGVTLVYEGTTDGEKIHEEFAVTHNTVTIQGVKTVEVHDTVLTNGELTEDTLDWFAQDKAGNVWYFGENTEELINGRPSTLAGTFTAGVRGAKPGIVMDAHPQIGIFRRQEFDLANAEDYDRIVSIRETVSVPEGTFKNCVRTHETTPLEPDLSEDKWYALGIGNVLTRDLNTGEEIRLVDIRD